MISPHIFLLGMLFYRRAFKVADLDGVEKLYRLKVPKGLRELSLELRDEIKNDYLFCELDRTVDGVRLDPSTALSAGSVGYSMRRVGEITGFATRVTPYCLRYGAAKTLNDSCKHLLHILARIPRADRNISLISPRLDTTAECNSAAQGQ